MTAARYLSSYNRYFSHHRLESSGVSPDSLSLTHTLSLSMNKFHDITLSNHLFRDEGPSLLPYAFAKLNVAFPFHLGIRWNEKSVAFLERNGIQTT